MPSCYPGIDIDALQIMPNHIHGIIVVGAAPCGRPDTGQPGNGHSMDGHPQGGAPTHLRRRQIHRRRGDMKSVPSLYGQAPVPAPGGRTDTGMDTGTHRGVPLRISDAGKFIDDAGI